MLSLLGGALLAVGGLGCALWIKRWMRSEQRAESFTLQDLREMRARGEISPREFETLKAEIINSVATEPGGRSAYRNDGAAAGDQITPDDDEE